MCSKREKGGGGKKKVERDLAARDLGHNKVKPGLWNVWTPFHVYIPPSVVCVRRVSFPPFHPYLLLFKDFFPAPGEEFLRRSTAGTKLDICVSNFFMPRRRLFRFLFYCFPAVTQMRGACRERDLVEKLFKRNEHKKEPL